MAQQKQVKVTIKEHQFCRKMYKYFIDKYQAEDIDYGVVQEKNSEGQIVDGRYLTIQKNENTKELPFETLYIFGSYEDSEYARLKGKNINNSLLESITNLLFPKEKILDIAEIIITYPELFITKENLYKVITSDIAKNEFESEIKELSKRNDMKYNYTEIKGANIISLFKKINYVGYQYEFGGANQNKFDFKVIFYEDGRTEVTAIINGQKFEKTDLFTMLDVYTYFATIVYGEGFEYLLR